MNPVIIAGPCVIESKELLETVAEELVRLNRKYAIDIIFKSSFDKANRTSVSASVSCARSQHSTAIVGSP